MNNLTYSRDYLEALDKGRPPNIKRLFPNSKALIVSGKVIDRAMIKKGRCMTIAANARNYFVARGVLIAAQRANAAIIVEIAKSEGGLNGYCAINYWNLARIVDNLCNELHITIPIAIHADHYSIKNSDDLEQAKDIIPSLFDYGITSIAIDASHLPEDENLLANIELSRYVPSWAGYETEVGEIKGRQGMTTVEEAEFHIRGLNANGIFPDWLAINNGTVHGIEQEAYGIDLQRTIEIHNAISDFGISGAQHGTSGNSFEMLKRVASETLTTKANISTALQMVSWGVKVNEYGNAILDSEGRLIKEDSKGIPSELWDEMVRYANDRGWGISDYKRLNLPFENYLLSLPIKVRDRITEGVSDFVYRLLTEVFNAKESADIALELILEKGSYDMGFKTTKKEDPADWTVEEIRKRASQFSSDHGKAGDYDD